MKVNSSLMMGYLALMIATLGWGINPVFAKWSVGEISPFLLNFLRWFFMLCILSSFALPKLKSDWSAIRPCVFRLWLFGIIGLAGFSLFYFHAAYYTSAVNIGLLQSCIPVATFLFMFLVYRTKVSIGQAVGTSITILGVIVVLTKGDLSILKTLTFNQGDLYMIIGSLCYAAYITALHNQPKVSIFSLFIIISFATSIFTGILAVYEFFFLNFQWPTTNGWIVLSGVVIFPTTSQIFFIYGSRVCGSSSAGLFVNCVPIFASFFAVTLTKELFSFSSGIALLLVLSGMFLAERHRHQKEK